MSIQHIETQPYLPKVIKWDVLPLPKTYTIADKSLICKMGLTPQMEEDPAWCIFMIQVMKECVCSSGMNPPYNIVDCKIQFGYKIKCHGKKLTPEFLFELMKMAYTDFTIEYNKRNINTHAAKYSLIAPKFNDQKKNLKSVIMMAGTSIQ